MKRLLFIVVAVITLINTACIPTPPIGGANPFVTYIINKGEQYSNNNGVLLLTNIQEMKFIAKFDSSAIYTSVNPTNQADINKLYGFSDNNTLHHENSARIGWRWYNNELQLLGYIYNNTVRSNVLIKAVAINTEISCSVKIAGDKYIFTVDGISVQMPRTSTTASGYKLYPYFGGDELAPHTIKILIKDL